MGVESRLPGNFGSYLYYEPAEKLLVDKVGVSKEVYERYKKKAQPFRLIPDLDKMSGPVDCSKVTFILTSIESDAVDRSFTSWLSLTLNTIFGWAKPGDQIKNLYPSMSIMEQLNICFYDSMDLHAKVKPLDKSWFGEYLDDEEVRDLLVNQVGVSNADYEKYKSKLTRPFQPWHPVYNEMFLKRLAAFDAVMPFKLSS